MNNDTEQYEDFVRKISLIVILYQTQVLKTIINMHARIPNFTNGIESMDVIISSNNLRANINSNTTANIGIITDNA